MLLQNLLLFFILVTILTYTFIPWEYKKGKFSKPSIKTIMLWWLIFAALSAIVTYFIRLIIEFYTNNLGGELCTDIYFQL